MFRAVIDQHCLLGHSTTRVTNTRTTVKVRRRRRAEEEEGEDEMDSST